jgi:hypothetical protein
LSTLCHAAAGMVTLSPMSVAPVCYVGDPLELICTASVQFIRWSVFRVNDSEEIIRSVQFNSRDSNQMPRNIDVNLTTFIFTRTSGQGASPLVSTLSIDSVGIGLNRTVVNCSDVSNPMTSASTTIYVISAANSTITLSKLIISISIISHSLHMICR